MSIDRPTDLRRQFIRVECRENRVELSAAPERLAEQCQRSDRLLESAFKAPTGNGPAVAGPVKDCSKPTVSLGVSPLAVTDPTWEIKLRVRDFANDIGVQVIEVDVILAVG